MQFVRTPFWPLHLLLDLAVVLPQAALLRWLFARRAPEAPRSPRAELPLIVAAVGAASLAWLPAVLVLGGIVGGALLARVAWITGTVSAPLCALWAARRWRAAWPAALALALLGAKYYGEVWEPNRLEVERLEVRLPGLRRPVKVAHLSDLQNDSFGALQARARQAANDFDPDLVVFTGDVLNHPSLAPLSREYLAGFHARCGKLFVSGDVEKHYDWRPVVEGAGFSVLDGKADEWACNDAPLGILGVPVSRAFDRGLIRTLLGQVSPPRILLSHRPDAAFAVDDGAVDLVLAGHTHGGQVCLPFFGPVVTLTRVPRAVAAGGLHPFGKTLIEVSRGLGWEGHIAPRVRAFCRPQLVLLTLVPAPKGAAPAVAR